MTEPSQACLASNLQGDEVARRLLVDDNAPLTTCPLSGKYKVEQAGLTCPTHVEMACDNPSLISISSCQSSECRQSTEISPLIIPSNHSSSGAATSLWMRSDVKPKELLKKLIVSTDCQTVITGTQSNEI